MKIELESAELKKVSLRKVWIQQCPSYIGEKQKNRTTFSLLRPDRELKTTGPNSCVLGYDSHKSGILHFYFNHPNA